MTATKDATRSTNVPVATHLTASWLHDIYGSLVGTASVVDGRCSVAGERKEIHWTKTVHGTHKPDVKYRHKPLCG